MAVGAGIAGFPMVFIPKIHAAWTPKTLVHPNIDNLRVVTVTDENMINGNKPNADWRGQDKLVVSDVVWENMDKLACELSELKDPEAAWKTIFVKPPKKSWGDTVVAIKTNNLGRQHTRSAVMAKICNTLTNVIGVESGNVYIYDASRGGMNRKSPFKGLPPGCRIQGEWGGIETSTNINAEAWRGSTDCLKYLVNGYVDILVNISMCKGHSSRFGGFTMTMKNHLGTFSPWPAHSGGGLDYLIGINQSPEVLGAMDKKSGKVLFPRQQLCLVDALWSSRGGPGGNSTHQTHFLAMGTLSPAVDYQVATHFRGARMGWKPNKNATRKMLKAFGYSVSDLPVDGRLIEI
jgi:hypothetical protein